MARFPVLSARDVLRALAKAGFVQVAQRGSHVRLKAFRRGRTHVVIVPHHAELAPGTMRSILRQAGLTREEFLALLD